VVDEAGGRVGAAVGVIVGTDVMGLDAQSTLFSQSHACRKLSKRSPREQSVGLLTIKSPFKQW